MIHINNTKKFYKPVPAVMWSIHPITQVITIRPTWDPYTKLILPKELNEYYSYGQLLSVAKLLRDAMLYPEGTKLVTVVRKNLAFFRQGYFQYIGRNVLIDPWYSELEEPTSINYYDPFMEYPELPKFYARKKS